MCVRVVADANIRALINLGLGLHLTLTHHTNSTADAHFCQIYSSFLRDASLADRRPAGVETVPSCPFLGGVDGASVSEEIFFLLLLDALLLLSDC